MKPFYIKPISRIKGKATFLGDKSVAHRAVLLSAITSGVTIIENFPVNNDCLSTAGAVEKLGVRISYEQRRLKKLNTNIVVYGVGLKGFIKPKENIFVGDSGTTLRMILGLLAGQPFNTTICAGKSLSKRPMSRVTIPLRKMGAKVTSRRRSYLDPSEEYPPICIQGASLKPIIYKMPVASAQVKSAILLAGLYSQGKTIVYEPVKTRDHTERMLKLFKADIEIKDNKVEIKGGCCLKSPKRIYIPADISSASFFIVLACILEDADLLLQKIGVNYERIGVIRVLKRMKAKISMRKSSYKASYCSEPMADISVKQSCLKATVVSKEEVPSLIDELPILMIAACFAKGVSVFNGVEELRVKETDRITSMVNNLTLMGADIKVNRTASGAEQIILKGVGKLHGAKVKSYGDHRTAMSMVVAALASTGATVIDDIDCIDKSFPNFFDILKKLTN